MRAIRVGDCNAESLSHARHLNREMRRLRDEPERCRKTNLRPVDEVHRPDDRESGS